MPFAIEIGIDGKPVCSCCRDMLWHCERCWNEHHNGKKDQDYTPPEYYGQSMLDEEIDEIMRTKYKIIHNPNFQPDKTRKYDERMYGH